jgi:hypothetical protein
MTRRVRAASSGLWVTSSTVSPSAFRSRKISSTTALASEVAGRLVRQEEPRAVDEGARDADALHLSARELRRPMVRAPAQPDAGEQFARRILHFLFIVMASYRLLRMASTGRRAQGREAGRRPARAPRAAAPAMQPAKSRASGAISVPYGA